MSPFLLAHETVGGIKLRPFSVTTQVAIDALSDCKFNRAEQAASLVWMQMREPAEVRAAVTDGTIEAKIRALAEEMPLAYLKPIEDWADRQNEMIVAGKIEIVPRDESGTDPGN